MSSKVALVTGGTGAVGPALVRLLVARGYQVRVLARHEVKNGRLSPNIAFIQGDITDPHTVQKAVAGCDVVFHLAAKLHLNNPSPALLADYRRINVEATKQLLIAAQAAQVRRFVFFSTINVYGTSENGQIFDEKTAVNPVGLYAQTKYEAENIALSFHSPSGEPLSVILRLAAVYGPHMKGNYARLARQICRGSFLPLGRGTNRRTLIFDEDVAQAALLAAEQPEAGGQIYNVTDGSIHTFHEILRAIYQAAKRPFPRLHLPLAPIRLFLAIAEQPFKLIGKQPPVGTFLIDKLQEDVAVSGQHLQQHLGFQPAFSLQRGWQIALQGVSHVT